MEYDNARTATLLAQAVLRGVDDVRLWASLARAERELRDASPANVAELRGDVTEGLSELGWARSDLGADLRPAPALDLPDDAGMGTGTRPERVPAADPAAELGVQLGLAQVRFDVVLATLEGRERAVDFEHTCRHVRAAARHFARAQHTLAALVYARGAAAPDRLPTGELVPTTDRSKAMTTLTLPDGRRVDLFPRQRGNTYLVLEAVDADSDRPLATATYSPTAIPPLAFEARPGVRDDGLRWALADLAVRTVGGPERVLYERHVGGTRTVVSEYGDGGDVLFVPGFGQSHRALDALREPLWAAGRNSRALDLRGFGDADPLDLGSSVPDQLVAFVRDAVAAFAPRWIVAHSLGARAVIEAAAGADWPSVEGVVAVAPALSAGTALRLLAQPTIRVVVATTLAALPGRVRAWVVRRAFARLAFAGRPDAAQLDLFEEGFATRERARYSVRAGSAVARALCESPVPVAAVGPPVSVVVCGRRDRFAPAPAAFEDDVAWIPDGGHFPWVEDFVRVMIAVEHGLRDELEPSS